ncbi:MAG: hypothetical protein M5U14_00920 [Acidimicrobiia bacterium]|nr:hypothetical protein [Acidimicrobiia bacterium]
MAGALAAPQESPAAFWPEARFALGADTSCDAETGEYTITWTVTSGHLLALDIVSTSLSTGGAVEFSPDPVWFFGTAVGTSVHPGTTSGDVDLSVTAVAVLHSSNTKTTTVELAGDCAPPEPETVTWRGNGAEDGVCDEILDPDGAPVALGPGEQLWQFNLTGVADQAQQPGGHPWLKYQFQGGPEVTDPGWDSWTGNVVKWWVPSAYGAVLQSASAGAVFQPQGNPVLTVSHCWGEPGGSIEVTKVVTGEKAPFEGEYEVCVEPADEGEELVNPTEVEWPWCQTIEAGETALFDGLAHGAYQVTETTTGDFTTTIVPDDGLVEVDEQTPAVTVTNDYGDHPRGSIEVTKEVTGEKAPDESVYEVCVEPVVVQVDALAVQEDDWPWCQWIGAGETAVFDDLLYGGYQVTETTTGDFTTTIVPDDGLVEVGEQTPGVTVTNDYGDHPRGSIAVTKEVKGDLAPDPGVTYEVCVEAGAQAEDLAAPAALDGPTCRTIAAGETAVFDELLLGAYFVTETTTGAFTTAITGGGQVTLDEASPDAEVTVTNDYGDASITVSPIEAEQPPATTTTAPPTTTSPPATAGTVVSAALPVTGSPTTMLLKWAAWTLAIGSLILVGTRRRRSGGTA